MRFMFLLLWISCAVTGTAAPGDKSPLSSFSKEWDNARYSACNTAANVSYMSDTEKQFIYIINLVRANPQLFCKTVLPKANRLSGFVDTSKEKFKELVKSMRTMKPMPLLQPDSLLYVFGHCHATTTGAKGLVTTDLQAGCDENKYKATGQIGHYGVVSPLSAIVMLLDKYSPMFNNYSRIAVTSAYHTVYQKVTMIELASATRSDRELDTITYEPGRSPLAKFSGQWNQPKYLACNTAAGAAYLSMREKYIIYILNLARVDPQLFCKTIVLQSHKISNSIDTASATYYKSLVTQLMTMKPLPLLQPDSACYISASCFATKSGARGQVGHKREDEECAGRTRFLGECCQYGINDPLGIVLSLLVDQNVSSLGHRSICLGGYAGMAPAMAPHTSYGVVAVLDFY